MILNCYNHAKHCRGVRRLERLWLILSDLFQVDTLSLFLFIIVTDYVQRQAYATTTDEHGIQITPRRSTRNPALSIKDLAYADDVTLLSQISHSETS